MAAFDDDVSFPFVTGVDFLWVSRTMEPRISTWSSIL